MFILYRTTLYNLRKIINVLKIIIVAILLLFIILMVKFKPMYKVTIAGETIGYVTSKSEVKKIINNYVNTSEGNIAFIDVEALPEYTFNFVAKGTEDSTNEVLQKIKENSTVTYRLYEIRVNDESKQYVATIAEAEEVVKELKEEFEGMVDLSIGVQEVFTQDLENIQSIDTEYVVASLDQEILQNAEGSIEGLVLSKPVSGIITYRYGQRWGRAHTGMDIAVATGTPIYAATKGTVEFTGWYGGYGNLVIVNHGNGIQTYYGHCSEIYCHVGDEVTKDTVLAAAGSTGNSTGPHLHFEIRKNGTPLNPQNYIYK